MMSLRFFTATMVALSLSQPAAAQQLGGGASPDVSLVRVFLALLVCLAVAVLALFLLRRRFAKKPRSLLPRLTASGSRIRTIESRRVAPQADVCIVECDGTEYLLLIAAGGTLLLRQSALPLSSGEEG